MPPSSPLNALLDGEWTAEFTPDWESRLPAILNGNATIHSVEESKQVEDFEHLWMERSKTKIVLVVVVKTDQRFEHNSRSCGALVQYEDGKVTRTKPFPLSYRLHFESTVATIAIAVDYAVQLDKDAEIYTVHYHAIDKALRPAKTAYYDIAERCFHRLGAWNHQLDCYWVPSHKLPKWFAAVKKKIAAHRKDVEPHKTIPAMKSHIRRLFKTEWAEVQEKLG